MAETLALVAAALPLVALHEAAHLAVARWYGFRTLCLGINPWAVLVVFVDEPRMGYLLAQTAFPLLVTAALLYLGLFLGPLSWTQLAQLVPPSLAWQGGFAFVLAGLTSLGDGWMLYREWRQPLWGRERVQRDLRILARSRAWPWFTPWGASYIQQTFGCTPQALLGQLRAPMR